MNTMEFEEIVNTKLYANFEDSHELMTQIRRRDPVCYVKPVGFRPFWLVSKYDDVKEVERKSKIFLSSPRTGILPIDQEQNHLKAFGNVNGQNTLLSMDGESHAKMRHVTQLWFMPANLQKIKTKIRELAQRHIDIIKDKGGECDFVNDVIVYYPLKVIMSLLGLPVTDDEKILRLTQQLFGNTDPDQGLSQGEGDLAASSFSALLEFREYLTGIMRERRENPTEDLASVIANATIDGELVNEEDVLGYYLVVFTAGHDTTSSTIAGALNTILDQPRLIDNLIQDGQWPENAVEECLRWVSPVRMFCRTAAEDYELRGKTIKKGESVALLYASANRDDEVFENPFKFDLNREVTPKHLGFGFGPHLCLGQYLARMEINEFMALLLKSVSTIEKTGDVPFVQSCFISGPKSLPIKVKFK